MEINFYPFHIGDYMAHTGHLEPMEDLAYRRMIDLYYVREKLLPIDPAEIAKLIRLRDQIGTVEAVLLEFFTKIDSGWKHDRCEYEIDEAQSKRNKASASAAKRWESERNANALPTDAERNAPNPNPNPNPNPKGEPKPSGYPAEFEEVWDAYPPRPGASKKDAFKAWSARIAAGVAAKAIFDGVTRYAAFCEVSGTEPRFIKQPTTFFGPGEHYLSNWSIPGNARASPSASRATERQHVGDVLTGRACDGKNGNGGNGKERDITGECQRVA